MLLIIVALFSLLFGDDEVSSLFKDLEQVEEIDKKINDELTFSYNYLMQGGYFVMPSTRVAKEGALGIGYSYLPPYQVIGLNFQLFDRLELNGNYLIFSGQLDSTFGDKGFGDEADRMGNVKFVFLKKGDGFDKFPEMAIGINDFLGSRRFRSFYFVATEEFLSLDLEMTLGWGNGRIDGFFGGLAWYPLRHIASFLKGFSFNVEYDANNYKHNKFEHPRGRSVKIPVNGGIKWAICDYLSFNLSSIRGKELAASASLNYNFGTTKGFLKKIKDPEPYDKPIDHEPLGKSSREEFIHNLGYAFKEQGIVLYSAELKSDKENRSILWLKVVNISYRDEGEVKKRIEEILASLIPKDIYASEVVVESDGLACHEYYFLKEDLFRRRDKKISQYEFDIIAPLKEATKELNAYEAESLYKRTKNIWIFTGRPILDSYFGRTTGKYKYDLGFLLGIDGYLFDEYYYNISGTYTFITNAHGIGDRDVLNPSRIYNVRTDAVRYAHTSSVHLETAYLQKNYNLSNGLFLKLSGGYFEVAYLGAGSELLFYPVNSNVAIGMEGAFLWKRNYYGFGINHELRRWKGEEAIYIHYDYLTQYFLSVYYDYKPLDLNFKVSVGQFLAKDKGIKFEMTKFFKSGLGVSLWYTFTNANDRVNNDRYFDKGFTISFPLDFFLPKSSKTRLNYSMAAWLRDIGAKAQTGKELYPLIYFERKRY